MTMDLDEAKQLLKETIDEAETKDDILRVFVEKIYQHGQMNKYEEDKLSRWRTYEGEITCEKCGMPTDEETPFCAYCGSDMRDSSWRDALKELRRRRGNEWEMAKWWLESHRDENGIVSKENLVIYDGFTSKVKELGKKIKEIEERIIPDHVCEECYWYSDVTVQTCEREHDPVMPFSPACNLFEVKGL